jgi:hypothetical protein
MQFKEGFAHLAKFKKYLTTFSNNDKNNVNYNFFKSTQDYFISGFGG